MFFLFLPAAQTRLLRFPDLLVAGIAAHAIGLMIGAGLNLSFGSLLGWSPDTGIALSLGGMTSLAVLPVTVILSFLCSRIGLFGFGASIAVGAAIGIAASVQWLEHPAHLPEHIWLGLCIGVPSSVAFWFVLRHRRPEAFLGDRVADRPWGKLLYAAFALAVVVLPYVPRAVDGLEDRRAHALAVSEFRGMLDEGLWEEAARDGPEAYARFTQAVEAKMQSIGLRETMVNNRIGFAEKLMRWGDFDKARGIYQEAAKAGGYPFGYSEPCVFFDRTFRSQISQGDLAGPYLACFRLLPHEVNRCMRCLSGITADRPGFPVPEFELPLVLDKTDPTYRYWQTERIAALGASAVAQGLSGPWRVELEAAPEGMMRGDLLAGVAVAFARAGQGEAARDLVGEALMEFGRLADADQRRMLRDAALRRVSDALRVAGEPALAREMIENIGDKATRERMLVRLGPDE